MDPELASEMVKLLAQELKVVRAQLREAERRTSTPHTGGPSNTLMRERAQELVSENDTLKADNAALQERVTRLQDELTRVSSIKSEEDLPSSLQYAEVPTSHTREEFARLLAENEDLIHEKVVRSTGGRRLNVTNITRLILNELRGALSDCTEELEQSRKAVVSEIDFRDLLKDLPYEPVEGQLELCSIQSYPRGVHTELHKDVMDICERLYFINHREVIWSPSGIALGLVVKPTFRYNPKVSGGRWTKFEDNFDIGKPIDICCLSGRSSRYLGTYERVGDQGTMIIAPESLSHLHHEKLSHAANRTTLFPDLVPPTHAQMIKNMYNQGVIKLECFVIRCVAV
ncbi:hypothetical protein HD554DRAFT_2285773 [Boletus coccyginus]|nr:hypothetical protein HD554DRAFT_2285773 [Boletus coccyginus]